jgi:hypothetical protein
LRYGDAFENGSNPGSFQDVLLGEAPVLDIWFNKSIHWKCYRVLFSQTCKVHYRLLVSTYTYELQRICRVKVHR